MTTPISPRSLSAGGYGLSPLATIHRTLLCVVLTAWCFLSLAAADGPENTPAQVLSPLHIDDFETATGLSKRSDTSDFDFMSPAEMANLAFGSPQSGNGSMMLANMTLHAAKELPIVMMERFEGVTSAVDCEGEDRQLSITFNSPESFEHAMKTWSYLNDDDDANFLLITNHDGCGPEDQRQAYKISKVDAVEESLTTYMFAESAGWQDIAGTFNMDFGQADLTPKGAQRLRIRGLGDLFAPVEKRDPALTQHLKRADVIDLNPSFSIGTEGKGFRVFRDPTRYPPRLIIDCKNCFARASFRLLGKLSLEAGKISECSLRLTVKEFRTVYEFFYQIVSEKDTNMKDDPVTPFKKEIFKLPVDDMGMELIPPFPVPGLGFTIPKLLEFGLTATATTHFEIQWFGRLNIRQVFLGYIPENAHIFLDFIGPNRVEVVGLEDTRFERNVDIEKAIFEGVITAWGAPKLIFGIDVLGLGKSNFEALLKLPQVRLNGTAGCEEGFCKEPPAMGPNNGGLKFTGDISTSLWCRLTPFDTDVIKLPKGIANLKQYLQFVPFQHMFTSMEHCKPFPDDLLCRNGGEKLYEELPPPNPNNPSPPPPPPPPGQGGKKCNVDGKEGTCKKKQPNGAGCEGGHWEPGAGPPWPCTGGEDDICCIMDGGRPPPPAPPKPPPKPPPAEGCKVDGRDGLCKKKQPNGAGCEGGYWAPGQGPPWPCKGGEDSVCCILGKPPPPTDEKCEVDGRSGFCREKLPDGGGCENGYFTPGKGPKWPCSGGGNQQCCIRGFVPPSDDKPAPPPPPPNSKCEAPTGKGDCVPRENCRGRAYTEPLCPGQPDNVQCCVQTPCEGPDPLPIPIQMAKPPIQRGWCRHKSQGCDKNVGNMPLPLGTKHEWRDKNGDAFSCPEGIDTMCCVAVN